MNDLNAIAVFVAVADHGGFSAAARSLDVPKSSISRQVGRLESRLGVKLLNRSARGVRLTDAGDTFYARCQSMLRDLEAAEEEIAHLRAIPSGIVRISCPHGLAQSRLAAILPGYLLANPLVRVQLIASDRAMNIVSDKIDIAVRARMQIVDEAIAMRDLGRSRLTLVASKSFLATQPRLFNLQDLKRVSFLSLHEGNATQSVTMLGPDRSETVELMPRLWTSDFNVLVAAACAGIGVALLPDEIARPHIQDGKLVQVLPSWTSQEVLIYLTFAGRKGLSPAVRSMIDYLVKHFPSSASDVLPLSGAAS